MDKSGDMQLPILEPPSKELLDYWLKIRGDDLVPLRSDLYPSDIQALLPRLMLLEYCAPDKLIYRLVGTGIVNRMGVELTGTNLFDTVIPKQLAMASYCYNAVRTHPCGLVLHMQMQSKYKAFFVAELIFLPLRDRQGEITQLVSSVSVLQRDARGTASDEQRAMKAFEAAFIDIGAGVPAFQMSA